MLMIIAQVNSLPCSFKQEMQPLLMLALMVSERDTLSWDMEGNDIRCWHCKLLDSGDSDSGGWPPHFNHCSRFDTKS